MDKLQFARLVSWVSFFSNRFMTNNDLLDLQDVIKQAPVEIPPFEPSVTHEMIANEMSIMFTHMLLGRKIDAIRSHRMLTKMGLKESKDEVERLMSCLKSI